APGAPRGGRGAPPPRPGDVGTSARALERQQFAARPRLLLPAARPVGSGGGRLETGAGPAGSGAGRPGTEARAGDGRCYWRPGDAGGPVPVPTPLCRGRALPAASAGAGGV